MASDNFNRANGALGANWTDQDGGSGGISISGNVAVDSNSGFNGLVYWNAETPANDQYSQVTLATNVGSADAGLGAGPACRIQTAATGNCYWLRTNSNTSQEVQLTRVDSGVETVLATYSSGPTPVVGDVFKIEATGTTLRAYKNGADVGLSPTDSTYSSGRCGMRSMDYNVVVGMDDWEGGSTVTSTLEQEGYRWRNDDGSESAATWAAAQDTGITAPVSENRRLRVLVNATADPSSKPYQLEYRLSSGAYARVLTAQPTTAIPTYVGKGTYTSGTGALSVPAPSGIAADDLLLLVVESANQTIATPTGYTQVANSPQSTGTAAAAGGVRVAVFYKVTTGSESNLSVADSGDHTVAQIFAFRGVNTTSPIDITAGSVDAAATASLSCPAVTTTQANCMVVNCIGLDKDLADTDTLSGAANASLSSVTERHDQTVASGFGGGLAVITGGLASAGSSGNTTATGDTSTTHAYVTVALAPTPAVQQAILLSPSSNIAASGAATTAQLAAPSGKTTSAFTVGRIQDDENPADLVDISADAYTELEWCLTAVSGVASNADVYQFRVTDNGTPLDTYTVTPQWTIGAGGGTAYSLTCDAGSVAVSGTDATLKRGLRVAADAGSVALTGTDASLERGLRLAADVGSVALTGTDATFRRGYAVAADSGSLALTGTDAALRATRLLSAESGAVAITGTDATLTHTVDRTLSADTGAVVVTGTDAALLATRRVSADAGSVALAGTDATLKAGRTLTAESGAVVLSGTDATLTHEQPGAYTLTADAGSVALTGQDAGLLVGHKVAAEAGAVALSGTDASLLRGRTLSAESGSLTATGTDATLRAGRRMAADGGSVALTGTAADLLRIFALQADAAAYSILGQAADLLAGRRFSADPGAYTLTGVDAALTWSGAHIPVPPFSARLTLTSRTPTLSARSRSPGLSVAQRGPTLTLGAVTGVLTESGGAWSVETDPGASADGAVVNTGDGYAIDDALTSGLRIVVTAGRPYIVE